MGTEITASVGTAKTCSGAAQTTGTDNTLIVWLALSNNVVASRPQRCVVAQLQRCSLAAHKRTDVPCMQHEAK